MLSRKTLLLSLIFGGLVPPSSCLAQWQQLPSTPPSNLFCIQEFDAQTLHAGGDGSLVLSTDGGDSWSSLPVTVFGLPFPGALHDVHFRTATEGYGVGAHSLGEQSVVLRTVDGGATWNAAYSDNLGAIPRTMNAIAFASATVGLAVGNNGKILRTTNGGVSWAPVTSGVTGDLHDVHFISMAGAIAVGENTLLRSVNGGASWTSQSFIGRVRDASFVDNSNGFAMGDDSKLYRTTNAGTSWQVVVPLLMDPIDFTAVHAVSTTLLYATSHQRIWRSTDGGLHWEWTTCPGAMEDVLFTSAGTGFAVGADGAIFRNILDNGPYVPSPYFTLTPSIFCEDSLVYCANGSAAGPDFTWLLNGVPFSTQTDASVVLSNASQTETIGLVATNGTLSDTAFVSVQVAATLQIQLQSIVVSDTLCVGQSTTVRVLASQTGTAYRLYRDATPIGASQNGNGGQLNFNTGNITQNDTLTIRATRTVAGCGTTTASTDHTILITTPEAAIPFAADEPAICTGDSTYITLQTSATNTAYQLVVDDTPYGLPVAGTGGVITLPTGELNVTTVYTVVATHSSGCSATLAGTAAVSVESPVAYFTMSSWNFQAGDPVDALNSTAIPDASYSWNFGAGAIPPTSTEESPSGIVFAEGTHSIQLTVTSPTGCQHSRTLVVHALAPFTPATCATVQGVLDDGNPRLNSLAFHPQTGDLYAMLNGDQVERTMFLSGHGDTLEVLTPFSPEGFDYAFTDLLVKFNEDLIPQWSVPFHHGSYQSEDGAISFAADGSVFVMFEHNGNQDTLKVGSTEGLVTKFRPSAGGVVFPKLIFKFDQQGRYQWHHALQFSTSNFIMRTADNGDLIIAGDAIMKRIDVAGNVLWSISGNFGDFQLDGDGNIWVGSHIVTGSLLNKYGPDGALLFSSPVVEHDTAFSGVSRLTPYGIELTGDGGVLLSGTVRGTYILGEDTLSHTEIDDNSAAIFAARLDPAGEPEWSIQVNSPGVFVHKGSDLNDGRFFTLVIGQGPVHLDGASSIDLDTTGWFLLAVEPDGENAGLYPVYTTTDIFNWWGTGRARSNMDFNSTTNEVAMMFPFNQPVAVGGSTTEAATPYPTSRHFIVVKGPIDCALDIASATPISSFVAPDIICAGTPVQLQDASAPSPTSWSWSMPGAVPDVSTEPSPTVQYAVPGTYSVTLVASNANGPGTTYTADVLVDICTGMLGDALRGIGLFPVPADDVLVINAPRSNGAPFSVYDITGRAVRTGLVQGRTEIDTSALPPGCYHISVHTEEGIRTRSFVVAHP